MRAVIQRVQHAKVEVEHTTTGQIKEGFLVLLGVAETDTEDDALYIANKIAGLRIFEDEEKKMNRSITDISGSILLVSQFTLFGDARKGRRPSFIRAAGKEIAVPLLEKVKKQLIENGIHVEEGIFGAHMEVSLLNDGPVTILLDSERTF